MEATKRYTATLSQRFENVKVSLEVYFDTYKEAALACLWDTFDSIDYSKNVRYDIMDNLTGEILAEGVRYDAVM